jgi:membrane associated rhomboid family serine protease
MFEEFKNAFHRPNNAHIQLIIINVVVFVVMAVLSVVLTISEMPSFFIAIHEQIAIPAVFSDFIRKPWTIITYSFAHDLSGILHILFNMLGFYWFGKLFVEYLGSDKLIAVYVLGAIAGGALYLIFYNTIPFYMSRIPEHGMVGASAAVFAVMVAVATLLPDYSFHLLFFGAVRIKYIALIYIMISILGSVQGNAGGNVAHLGGALIGFVYTKQMQAGVNWGTWITWILDSMRKIFAPKQRVKVTYRKDEPKVQKPSTKISKASQEEIDIILDKISDRGYESLSKDEKEKLFNASKK